MVSVLKSIQFEYSIDKKYMLHKYHMGRAAAIRLLPAAARPMWYLSGMDFILIMYSHFDLFRTKPCFSSETSKI